MRKSALSHRLVRVPVVSITLLLLIISACTTVPQSITPATSAAPSPVRLREGYGKIPLHFEANVGQTADHVQFLARSNGYTAFLAPTETVLVVAARSRGGTGMQARRTILRTILAGANPESRLIGVDELPARANYFIGSDPTKWRTNVRTYGRVEHKNAYPGIDVVYYGHQRQLEYDFVVRPGADPRAIALSFEGADALEVDTHGDLLLHTPGGVIRQRRPVVYQDDDGVRREVAGSYVVRGPQRIGFQIGAYDTRRRLVIDPALFFSTYLGGSNNDVGAAIAVDAEGNAYVTGDTGSVDFPTTTGAAQPALAGIRRDAFVAKLDPTGSTLIYATYLGGTGEEFGFDIAVDVTGNAYVTGVTDSADFPTTPGALRTSFGGGLEDGFVTKLNATGTALIYSTYLGGAGRDAASGIAVDNAGNAYVTGFTTSTDFPTTLGAYQTVLRGGGNAFLTKFSPTGLALYSTYFGGTGGDQGSGVAVDALGNAYITGSTASTDLPTVTPVQPAFAGGQADAFVAKFDPTGSTILYSSYLGGTGYDIGRRIAVDAAGSMYVAGVTGSTDFPVTAGAFQTTYGGGPFDAFIARLDPMGATLVYSTYLGASGNDDARGLAIDVDGNAYVAGLTDSPDFPTAAGAFQMAYGGGFADAFVTKLNSTGSGLVYSSYLGGSGAEWAQGIAIDQQLSPNAYVTGLTDSADFPTTPGALQSVVRLTDAFVAQIVDVVLPPPTAGRVTGGGTIDVTGGIGNFHFIVQRQTATGPISGRLQYVNHASGARVQSQTIDSFAIAGNMATFHGTCTLNGTPCTFDVHVTDNGEPGTNDTFTITVNLGPTDGGTLRSGNILIR